MLDTLLQLIAGFEPWQIAIEMAVIWVCVWVIFRFLEGTRGAGIIKGFAMLLVGTMTIRVLTNTSDAFTRINFIYDRALGVVAILLIVVFQAELRQAMGRLGHAWPFRGSQDTAEGVIDAVAEAVAFLSKSQFGALIAIERRTRLGGLVETGVLLDAQVRTRLLESIFWPNSPLHDLGVVIRGDRIVAASVQFPLAEEGHLPVNFGSRHRAAAGLSQETDCVVVIVSEETGAISIAERGRIAHDLPRDEFRARLAERLAAPVSTATESEASDAPAVADAAEAGSDDEGPDEKQAA